MASSPLSPSTITERASCSVAPTKAIRADPSLSAIERTHSAPARVFPKPRPAIISHTRSEEHTSELQSLMRNSYAVFCLKKKNKTITTYKHKLHTQKLQIIKYQVCLR